MRLPCKGQFTASDSRHHNRLTLCHHNRMLIIGNRDAIIRLQGPTIGLLLNVSGFSRDVGFYSEYKPFGQTLRELRREVARNDARLFMNSPADAVTTQL